MMSLLQIYQMRTITLLIQQDMQCKRRLNLIRKEISMTKIFLDNYGLITASYFGKDGYAVIGLSDRGYKCIKRFFESEKFRGIPNTILSEATTMDTDVNGIKYVMVLDRTSFLYVIGCLNT